MHLALVKSCVIVFMIALRKSRTPCSTGEAIEREFGIPIVNKRISVTPISLVAVVVI